MPNRISVRFHHRMHQINGCTSKTKRSAERVQSPPALFVLYKKQSGGWSKPGRPDLRLPIDGACCLTTGRTRDLLVEVQRISDGDWPTGLFRLVFRFHSRLNHRSGTWNQKARFINCHSSHPLGLYACKELCKRCCSQPGTVHISWNLARTIRDRFQKTESPSEEGLSGSFAFLVEQRHSHPLSGTKEEKEGATDSTVTHICIVYGVVWAVK